MPVAAGAACARRHSRRKPAYAAYRKRRVRRICACYAADRSLWQRLQRL